MKKLLIGLSLLMLSAFSQASVVALYGTSFNNNNMGLLNAMTAFLQKNGHTVVYKDTAAPDANSLQGVDAVIAMRTPGNDAIKDFVLNGGLLITEWKAAEWALNTADLINAKTIGTYTDKTLMGTNTLITQTDAAMELGLGDRGVGKQYADKNRTEYSWLITEVGEGVDVLGTMPNGKPVTLGGHAGKGYVIANTMDWGDNILESTLSAQWLLNALDIKFAPPPPEPVSEPALPLLLGSGLAALLFNTRRRRSSVQHS